MSIDTQFVIALRERIAEERKRSEAVVIDGRGVADFAQYRYSLGYMKALDDIMTISDEILETIQKG